MENETPPDGNTAEETSKKTTVKSVGGAALEQGKKAAAMVDKASTVAESASGAFGAIKWTAIAIVTIIIAGGAYGTYKVVSAPVKAVGSATEAVTDSVKSGADKLKESSSAVANRLNISVSQQSKLNRVSDAAFSALSNMAATKPQNVKDRMSRVKNFPGSNDRVCAFNLDFGNGELPVTLAADNDAHASAKALGSKGSRMMRMIVEAGKDDLALSAVWDEAASKWTLKWKATTLKKTLNDKVAEQRALDVLSAAIQRCK